MIEKNKNSKENISKKLTRRMKITRVNNIFSKKIKNKWVILEPNKEYVRELDEVAGLIWEMAQKPVTTETIAKKLSLIYQHSLANIKKDVEEFVRKYLKEGFLKEVPQ